MPTPAAAILHGDFSTPLLLERDITRRLNGLDGGTLRYLADSETAFTTGQVIGGLEVEDCRRQQDGTLYEFSLSMYGVDGVKPERQLRGFPDVAKNMMDWDTVEDAYITTNSNKFLEGQSGSYGGVTVCVSALPRRLHGNYYEVRGRFVGLISNKPRQRTMTANGQTISGDLMVVNLPGGWTTPRKSVAQLPKLVVRDRYLTTSPPPTHLLPGPATPIGAPSVKFMTFSGVDVTSYWPGGWHLASLSSQQIGDRGLYANDWVYEYQFPVTP